MAHPYLSSKAMTVQLSGPRLDVEASFVGPTPSATLQTPLVLLSYDSLGLQNSR